MFKIVEDVYNVYSYRRKGSTIQDLKEALRRMIDTSTSIYLIVDALDEYEDRSSLLKGFEDLRS